MTAIAGILSLGDAPRPPGVRDHLVDALSHHGEAVLRHDAADGVLLEFGSGPGEQEEDADPLRAAVDSALGASSEPAAGTCGRQASRSRLVAELRRGDGFRASAIPQECAAVFWNRAERTAWAIRDWFGIRPLYWATAGEYLLFASEVQAILRTGLIEPTPDWERLRDLVVLEFRRWNQVPVRGVRVVHPGHVVRFRLGHTTEQRYWTFEPAPPRRRSLREYQDEFHHLLERSVERRLEGHEKAAVFVSGGLDSSSISAVAGEVAVNRARLGLFHAAMEHPDAREMEYARIAASGIDAEFIAVPQTPGPRLPEAIEQIRVGLHPIVDPVGHILRSLARACWDLGYNWALDGYPADDLLSAGRTDPLIQLKGLRLGSIIEVATRFQTLRALGRKLLQSFLLRSAKPQRSWPSVPSWITPSWPAPVDDAPPPEPPGLPVLGAGSMALELVSREIAPQHVQLTFPFLDTELALFLLNLPRIVNRWPGETKTLLRRSMTGLVDQRILRRRDKANFRNALIEDLLRYDLPEILDTIRRGPLQQMGLIDPKRFEERLLNVRRNPPESLALWETVCIDLWLREVANGIRKRPGGDAEGGKKDIQHSRVEDGRAPNGDYQ